RGACLPGTRQPADPCGAHVYQRVVFVVPVRRAPRSPVFAYATLFRSRISWPFARTRAGLGGLMIEGVGRTVRTQFPSGSKTRNRSEEHTSELQSRENLVCRLLLERKNRRGLCKRCYIAGTAIVRRACN